MRLLREKDVVERLMATDIPNGIRKRLFEALWGLPTIRTETVSASFYVDRQAHIYDEDLPRKMAAKKISDFLYDEGILMLREIRHDVYMDADVFYYDINVILPDEGTKEEQKGRDERSCDDETGRESGAAHQGDGKGRI